MKTRTLETTYLNQEIHITGHADGQTGNAFFTETNPISIGAYDASGPGESTGLKAYDTAEKAYAGAQADIASMFEETTEDTEEARIALDDILNGADQRTTQTLADALQLIIARTATADADLPKDRPLSQAEHRAAEFFRIYEIIRDHKQTTRRTADLLKLTQEMNDEAGA
jgi:rubrerythrin